MPHLGQTGRSAIRRFRAAHRPLRSYLEDSHRRALALRDIVRRLKIPGFVRRRGLYECACSIEWDKVGRVGLYPVPLAARILGESMAKVRSWLGATRVLRSSAKSGVRRRSCYVAKVQKPDSCTAANDVQGVYSITSSARASNVDGISKPSALAVLRLITSSYLVGACTGRSAGFSPFRMDQAGIIFSLAAKMVRMNPALARIVTIQETAKSLVCTAGYALPCALRRRYDGVRIIAVSNASYNGERGPRT